MIRSSIFSLIVIQLSASFYKISLASALETEVMAHLRAGVDNVAAGATYQHVDPEVS